MSAHRTTRRAMLNSTAALSLAAAVGTGAALAAPLGAETSFPDLVARFIPVRERWRTQRASDLATSQLCDEFFQSALGFSIDEFRALRRKDPDDPRALQGNKLLNKFYDEHGGPCDKHGCSIAWTEISDELWPLAEEMLSRTPRSLADVAWQVEALFVADPEFHYQMGLDDGVGDGASDLRLMFVRNIRAVMGLS